MGRKPRKRYKNTSSCLYAVDCRFGCCILCKPTVTFGPPSVQCWWLQGFKLINLSAWGTRKCAASQGRLHDSFRKQLMWYFVTSIPIRVFRPPVKIFLAIIGHDRDKNRPFNLWISTVLEDNTSDIEMNITRYGLEGPKAISTFLFYFFSILRHLFMQNCL